MQPIQIWTFYCFMLLFKGMPIKNHIKQLSLKITGDIVGDSIKEIERKINRDLESQHINWVGHTLQLDMTAVQDIDSKGLTMMATIADKISERGGNVRCLISNKNLLREFTFTRMNKLVEIEEIS